MTATLDQREERAEEPVALAHLVANAADYVVCHGVVSAACYGLPQSRQRPRAAVDDGQESADIR
jgi:hypothetical protein